MSARAVEPPPKSRVERRLYQRVLVLKEWNETGIPPEYVDQLPTSIRSLGKWHEPRLGIEPMKDPNSLVLDHEKWGWRVKAADKLMKELAQKLASPQLKKTVGQVAQDRGDEVRELKTMLTRAVDQWHEARETAVRAVRDAEFHAQIHKDQTQQINDLNERLDLRDRELAQLRRDLAKLQSTVRLHRP